MSPEYYEMITNKYTKEDGMIYKLKSSYKSGYEATLNQYEDLPYGDEILDKLEMENCDNADKEKEYSLMQK